jgi:hypothetical protein
MRFQHLRTTSHRKAGFLFLEWLANPNEKLVLDKKIGEYDKSFVDLVLRQMLVKNYERRMTLAECLSHQFVSSVKIPGLATDDQGVIADEEHDDAAKAAIRKRRDRTEDTGDEYGCLMKGTLLKLNVDGDPKNKDNWLKRDIWLTGNGNLCYFSQKKGKKLVLLDHEAMVRHTIETLKASDSCMEFAFILKPRTDDGSDESALAEDLTEAQLYSCADEDSLKQWVDVLGKAISMDHAGGKLVMDADLMEDFKNFKIEVKNRREKFEKTKGFEPAYKCELWKLNQEGDMMNAEHWLKREMWIAKNGAFCYYSKKEGRELQYYKSTDIRFVTCDTVEDAASCKPFTFTLTLPPTGGLEYAPGVFAAMTGDEKDNFLYTIRKFQRARAAHDAAMAKKKAGQ